MAYKVKTERLELPEDNYAEIAVEMLHGTQRGVEDITRKFLKFPEGTAAKFIVKEGQKPKVEGLEEVEIDLEHADFTAANDTIILGQVVAWSFGEVTRGVLDGLPLRITDMLKAKCDELFGAEKGAVPLVNSGDAN